MSPHTPPINRPFEGAKFITDRKGRHVTGATWDFSADKKRIVITTHSQKKQWREILPMVRVQSWQRAHDVVRYFRELGIAMGANNVHPLLSAMMQGNPHPFIKPPVLSLSFTPVSKSAVKSPVIVTLRNRSMTKPVQKRTMA